jgi:uncharacterized protein (TIGR03437 family)
MKSLLRISAWSIASFSLFSQTYSVTTVAGTSRLLDGSQATMVPLRDPNAVALDTAGNLYIADDVDNRVRKISNGIITTVAGTGLPGYTGDRGPAAAAQLSGPFNIAVDSKNNVFIVDRDNFVVRRVSPDGTINTVAGSGQRGFGGEGEVATAAMLQPLAVTTDTRGNLYISDFSNRVVRVDSNGILTRIAGNGKSGSSPDNTPAVQAEIGLVVAMTTDNQGNLYLADASNYFVRKIDTNGILSTVAGAGSLGLVGDDVPATQALVAPSGIGLNAAENTLYLSDFNFNLVRKVDLVTGLIETVAGNGSAGFSGESGQASLIALNFPAGITVDPTGIIYFADRFNARIRKIVQFQVTTVAGTNAGDGKSATSAFLNFPTGVAVDVSNHLGIADSGNLEFRVATLGGSIIGAGQVNGSPTAVAVDSSGDFFVSDNEPLVLKITPTGTTVTVAGNGTDSYDGDQGLATSASISNPTGVAVDAAGNIYITDYTHNRVRKVSAATGIITTIAGNGNALYSKDNVPATSTGIDPFDVAVDSASNVYIADQLNNRIRKIGADGTITTVAGNGSPGYSGDGGYAVEAQLSLPSGIAFDRAGNMYVADFGNSVVRLVTTGGLIRTIAGNGTQGPASGDGGPARAAAMNPIRLAVDSRGNVYVSDSLNDRIRLLTPMTVLSAAISIVSGNNQSAIAGSPLPARLVIQVTDAAGAPVPGAVVTFSASPADAVTLNPTAALTLDDGTASTSVTLGMQTGTLSVSASTPGLNPISFDVTSNPAVSPTAPVIAAGGIASAGLSIPSVKMLAPGGIATIFGANFAPAGTAKQVGPGDLVKGEVPTNLVGTCVQIGDQRSPMLNVYPGQLNIQVPELPPGDTSAIVINKCGTPNQELSAPEPVTIGASSPEFFYWARNVDGHNPIAALNATTGAYVGVVGLLPHHNFAPAAPGDVLTLFGTNFGATNPAYLPGVLPKGIARVTAPVSMTIGNINVPAKNLLYVGLTQFPGVYQVNVKVPAGVPDGDQPAVLTIGGVPSPSQAYITVKHK